MPKNPSHLHDLVSHDGLKDALTGLMSLSAFLESGNRFLFSASRERKSVNLFLFSMLETKESAERLAVNEEAPLDQRNESEILELSARVLLIANEFKLHFRSNDLISRYTFADFLLMNSGSFFAIQEKLADIFKSQRVAFVGVEIPPMNSSNSKKSTVDALPLHIGELESRLLLSLNNRIS